MLSLMAHGMELTFRVEDPDAFNEPWTAKQRFRRVEHVPKTTRICSTTAFRSRTNLTFKQGVQP